MTLFARYYDNKTLVETSMNEMENFIKDELNKEKIANAIFHRYYDRYLKIFYFQSEKKALIQRILRIQFKLST